MEGAYSPLRAALDYLGFMVYATIVGGGLPDRETADAGHPRHQLATARRPALTLVPAPDIAAAPASPAAVTDDRDSNAA